MAGKLHSHTVSSVRKTEGSDKGFWTEVGAAWAHGDGKGYNIKLNLLPIDGSDIVMRVREPRDDAGQSGK